MKKLFLAGVCVLSAALVFTPKVHSSILISEILADPPSGVTGDSNQDGTGHFSQDEFVELYNSGSETVDLSGWFLTDVVATRHVFTANTFLAPNVYLVIFGGGSPSIDEINWQIASSGSLGLNNSGDTVSIFNQDSLLATEISYGSIGGNDQSIALVPGGEYVLHSQIEGAEGELFSPGWDVQSQSAGQATVPEPITLLSFSLGSLALGLRKKYLF